MNLSHALALLLLPASAAAQSFNMDFGPAGSEPPSSYAAAGIPGTWNSMQIPHTSPSSLPHASDVFLVDLGGNPTSVRVHQFGGMSLQTIPDASVTGDDALLLHDGAVTFSSSLETCLFINGLENGMYEVLTYAWRPNEPGYKEKVRLDFVPGTVSCGGAWTGAHAEGVTYTRHIVNVTTGYLGPHVGVLAGFDPATGSMACGMQLRKLTPEGTISSFCMGDGGDQVGCTNCPCGNNAPVGSSGGCINTSGSFSTLVPSGNPSVAADTLRFQVELASPIAFGILVSGASRAPTNAANPCFGSDSGIQALSLDGLRCVLQGIRRHGGRSADSNGAIGQTNPGWGGVDNPPAGLIAQGGFASGETRHYQVIYRDDPDFQCGTGLNTTNGVSVTFVP